MAKRKNLKTRKILSVLIVLLISLIPGALLFFTCVRSQSAFWHILGQVGITAIVLFDLLLIMLILSSGPRRNKRNKPATERPVGYDRNSFNTATEVNLTAPPKKAQSKKNRQKSQIDLNIRPLDDSAFNIVRNMITTASSIILGTRKEQQDALYVSDTVFFGPNESADAIGIVCDGMGGLANGSAASKTAVRTVSSLYSAMRPLSNVGAFFQEAIYRAQAEVQALSDATPGEKRAGSTFVSAIIQKDKLYTAAVGDSRIYIIRNGQIKLLTRDHNYYLLLKEKVRNGEITEQEMNSSSQKEALISYLGIPELTLMDIMSSPLQLIPGDIVLLCSDGLTKTFTKEEICEMIISNSDKLQSCADFLTEAAQRRCPRGLDNTSVILLKYS